MEVPLARASDEERLAKKSFDALDADGARPALPADVAPRARRRRCAARAATSAPRGRSIDMRAHAPRQPAHGGRPDPARAQAPQDGAAQARDAVRHQRVDGAVRPRVPPVPDGAPAAARTPRRSCSPRGSRASPARSRSRHPERAIERAAAAAPDWSSGTRIGDALKAFNDRHGRRGMARGAVVVILSDGWERGEPALVSREMERPRGSPTGSCG